MYLPDYYEFSCGVKTIAGHKALDNIADIMEGLCSKVPMIITGEHIVNSGLLDIVINALKKNDSIIIGPVEDDVPPDSDLKYINRLALVYREKQCDSIIAVGGGSVLDTAKGVNILVSENSDDLMQFTGAGTLKKRLKPLIAVPTTSGTGSEVTIAAVIADHENHRKLLFGSNFLLPDVAVIDTRMTMTLPSVLTSTTAMDALTHAIEAFTCLSKNPLSDVNAILAIRLITDNLLNVVKNPEDSDGRFALANAATLAGIAFSNSTVGMVHTIGHSVGGVCGVPHGVCMAILLPYALEYNMHKIEKYTAELLLYVAGSKVYCETSPEKRAEKTIAYIRQLNQDLFDATDGKHFRFFKEVTNPDGTPMVPKEKLEEIARTALGDGSIFYNPEEIDFDDFMVVLDAAWNGYPLDRNLVKKGEEVKWTGFYKKVFNRS